MESGATNGSQLRNKLDAPPISSLISRFSTSDIRSAKHHSLQYPPLITLPKSVHDGHEWPHLLMMDVPASNGENPLVFKQALSSHSLRYSATSLTNTSEKPEFDTNDMMFIVLAPFCATTHQHLQRHERALNIHENSIKEYPS